jgi:hypothetical protein
MSNISYIPPRIMPKNSLGVVHMLDSWYGLRTGQPGIPLNVLQEYLKEYMSGEYAFVVEQITTKIGTFDKISILRLKDNPMPHYSKEEDKI